MTAHFRSRCPRKLSGDRGHHVKPSEYYHPSRGYAPWLVCVDCGKTLWGLYTITEENNPWT